jgi:hypothetical protein
VAAEVTEVVILKADWVRQERSNIKMREREGRKKEEIE